MNTNDEEAQEYRALRTVVVFVVIVVIATCVGAAIGYLIARGTQAQQADRVRDWMLRGSVEAYELQRALTSGEIVITNEQPFIATWAELKKLRRTTAISNLTVIAGTITNEWRQRWSTSTIHHER